MFTGIIQAIGTVADASPGGLSISSNLSRDARLGDSIAVNGVDLTVARRHGDVLGFDVMPETWRRSSLGQLRPGDRVNLEPSVRPIDRLSGHLVRGVVEDVATLVAAEPDGEATVLRFTCDRPDLRRRIVVKGPVALDGVSFTVIDVDQAGFSVSMVQYTAAQTTFGTMEPGAVVNLETDIIARYVEVALAGLPTPRTA